MKNIILLFTFLALLSFLIPVYAHTVDSVGEYRLEIGWMNEPVVSSETNGIELYVSPFDSNIPIEDQEFVNGISGLEKTLKMQLVLNENKITLPLKADHNIPGKYYAFVDPTVSGFYQANILGEIKGTIVSLSMHPPKVNEREYIEFPEPSDITVRQIIDGHTALIEDINDLKDSVVQLENSNQVTYIGYIGIGFGIAGLIVALIAISKTRK
ncbi:MAG TPA: hypothetical protein VLA01_00320 [Nitrosopumilaceae archaeon]|nr:hypothetical protein [Nitrosopumilaceae archaeon]